MCAAPQDSFVGRQSSVIFEVLPTSIQAIIPPLPSLRRTVSGKGMKATSFLSGALLVLQPQSTMQQDGPLGGQATADSVGLVLDEDVDSLVSESSSVADASDNHRSTLEPRSTRSRAESTTMVGKRPTHRSSRSFPFLRLPGRSSSLSHTPEPVNTTGIDYKFQRRGQEMLRAAEEETDLSNPEQNVAFARRSYIDGVAYLLQGLPRDLDGDETSILRGALPEPLRREMGNHRHQLLADNDSLRSSTSSSPTRTTITAGENFMLRMRSDGPSPIHRAVQTVITTMIFMTRLMISLGIAIIQELVRVGNEYQIPERVTRRTILMASSFASIGTSAASTIGSVSKASYNMVDDRVPYGLGSVLQWLTDECVSGACAGVREGLRCQV
ncbi:hypothetical protein ACKVWC_004508 [Pyricularia oryzae]